MNRIAFGLMTAATIALAAPASAQSFGVFFPTLTFPPQPTQPVSDQSCVNLTTLNEVTCAPVAK